jgi:hypothetical protein
MDGASASRKMATRQVGFAIAHGHHSLKAVKRF